MTTRLTLLGIIYSVLMLPLASHAEPDYTTQAPAVELRVVNEALTMRSGGLEFELRNPAVGTADRESFEAMTAEQKAMFHRKRENFLRMALKTLSVLRLGFGIGGLIGDRLVFRLREAEERRLRYEYQRIPGRSASQEALIALDGTREDRIARQNRLFRLSMRHRARMIIGGVLRSLDRAIWRQAPVFTSRNEGGLMVALGGQATSSQPNQARGAFLTMGISVGYNHDIRGMAIQIFGDYERAVPGGIGFAFGAVAKGGFYVSNQRPGQLRRVGTGVYPPGFPGFASMTPDSFRAGLSSGGPLAFPYGVADASSFVTRFDDNVLVRFTVSPFTPGFVRLNFGHFVPIEDFATYLWKRFIPESIRARVGAAQTTAANGIARLRAPTQRTAAPTCQALFR